MSFLLWVSHSHAARDTYANELQVHFQVGHLDTKILFCLHSSMSTIFFSQPELCCCTSQLVAYICLLKPAGTPTSPRKWLNMSGVPLQLTEHATASKGTLQLQVPPVGLFVLPSVLPTISTAATMCSEVPPTYHTVVPTSMNLLQHSARQHTKKRRKLKLPQYSHLLAI